MSDFPRVVSAREEMLARYFRAFPTPPDQQPAAIKVVSGITLGAVAVITSFLTLNSCVGCGWRILAIALLCGGAALLYQGLREFLANKYNYEKSLVSVFPQPTDQEVDHWRGLALAKLRQRSLEALELTRDEIVTDELPPILGPVLWPTPGVAPESLVQKQGQDGRPRFGVYQVSYLWLAEAHVGIFTCTYDLVRNAALNEATYDFFYQDIVSVTTREQGSALTLPNGSSLTTVQEFRISVANDRYFAMTLGAEKLRELTGSESVPDSGTGIVVKALRTQLRQLKGSLRSGGGFEM